MNSTQAKFLLATALAITFSGCSILDSFSNNQTHVVETYPQNGSTNVDTGVVEISFTFNNKLFNDGHSGNFTIPKGVAEPIYIDNNLPTITNNTFTWLVGLEPKKKYVITINAENSLSKIKDINGNITQPYTLTFETGGN